MVAADDPRGSGSDVLDDAVRFIGADLRLHLRDDPRDEQLEQRRRDEARQREVRAEELARQRARELVNRFEPLPVDGVRLALLFNAYRGVRDERRGRQAVPPEELVTLYRVALAHRPDLLELAGAASTDADFFDLDYAARRLWTTDSGLLRDAIHQAAAMPGGPWITEVSTQLLHPVAEYVDTGSGLYGTWWQEKLPVVWPGEGAAEILDAVLIATTGGYAPGTRIVLFPKFMDRSPLPADAVTDYRPGPAGIVRRAWWHPHWLNEHRLGPSFYEVYLDGVVQLVKVPAALLGGFTD